MNGLNLTPFVYARLHRWDRLVLSYYILMKIYYEEKSMERIKNDPKNNPSDYNKNLPTLQVPPRLRGRRG